MDDPLALAVLSAACAVAEGALPERESHPHPVRPWSACSTASPPTRRPSRPWSAGKPALLTELGYGLDLSACAVTGAADSLRFVSPRTGRAVSAAAAGTWAQRLLPLPAFLRDGGPGCPRSTGTTV